LPVKGHSPLVKVQTYSFPLRLASKQPFMSTLCSYHKPVF